MHFSCVCWAIVFLYPCHQWFISLSWYRPKVGNYSYHLEDIHWCFLSRTHGPPISYCLYCSIISCFWTGWACDRSSTDSQTIPAAVFHCWFSISVAFTTGQDFFFLKKLDLIAFCLYQHYICSSSFILDCQTINLRCYLFLGSFVFSQGLIWGFHSWIYAGRLC